MSVDKKWEQYLYGSHSRAELWAWARELRFFRFCRAYGGHANDGDSLRVELRHHGEQDAQQLCAALGFEDRERAIIHGTPVFVHVYKDTVSLALSGAAGSWYEVSSADVANAVALESRIAPLAERVIDPPIANKHCISPAMYPELWSDE
jgi:hypothetical protein